VENIPYIATQINHPNIYISIKKCTKFDRRLVINLCWKNGADQFCNL